jgi:hypothetical protein
MAARYETKQEECEQKAEPLVPLVMRNSARPRKACVICWAVPSFKCCACMSARYCGADCQRRAWQKHKPDCQQMQSLGMPVLRGHNDYAFAEHPDSVDYPIIPRRTPLPILECEDEPIEEAN